MVRPYLVTTRHLEPFCYGYNFSVTGYWQRMSVKLIHYFMSYHARQQSDKRTRREIKETTVCWKRSSSCWQSNLCRLRPVSAPWRCTRTLCDDDASAAPTPALQDAACNRRRRPTVQRQRGLATLPLPVESSRRRMTSTTTMFASSQRRQRLVRQWRRSGPARTTSEAEKRLRRTRRGRRATAVATAGKPGTG